ncbi:signal peptidase I [bacterium]|nr:signal peptidase I [bacterium]
MTGQQSHEAVSLEKPTPRDQFKKQADSGRKRSPSDHHPKTALRENVEAIVVALILALLVRTFIFQAFKIPSGSMKDTLLVGDHILVNKFIYETGLPYVGFSLFPHHAPERNDIIVFKYPKEPNRDFIKRCIAKGDDTLYIRGDEVKINNVIRDEPFVKKDERQLQSSMGRNLSQIYNRYGPRKIPEHKYFMMGDNRYNSQDSRYWGLLDQDLIKGKAFLIYLSINDNRGPLWTKIRWNRFFKIIR